MISMGREFFVPARTLNGVKLLSPPLFREKGDPAISLIPKCTNQVSHWYQLVWYQENTNQYQPKIPTWYATLVKTIRLEDTRAVELFTIIFPWGKYSYLSLPMGFAGSVEIFQAEMMDLMKALEYVRAYINNLLVITRDTLEDHLPYRPGVKNQLMCQDVTC